MNSSTQINAGTVLEDVAESRRGNQDAFGRIVARYQNMVSSVAFSHVGDHALAQDIAQEAFLVAWQRIDRLEHAERLGAWLAGIARNIAREALRKRTRDPIHAAAEISENEPGLPDGASGAEADAVVWESLQRMPELYREPLVLYYREGHSVRATADLLGLTEDCVKQRLSRGRAMLRERVESLVEDTLRSTRLGESFTWAVVAALPLGMVATGTAHAAAGVAAAKLSGAAGKAAAGTSIVMIGGLVGGIVGMTGGLFGLWRSIVNSPSLRTRRYVLKASALTYAFVWLFLGYQAMCGVLFWQQPYVMAISCGIGWALYVPLLFVLIVKTNNTVRNILRQELDDGAPGLPELEQSALSTRSLTRSLHISLALATIGSLAIALWLQKLPGVHLGLVGLASAAMSHYAYAKVYRHGMRIAADEIVFAETSSAISIDQWLHPKRPPFQGSPRAKFWNDFIAVAGGVVGPACWLIVAPAMAGQWEISIAVAVQSNVALALTVWGFRRWPDAHHWVIFAGLIVTGVFDAAIITLYSEDWVIAGIKLSPIYGWAGGLVVLGLYVSIAGAIVYIRNDYHRK